MTIITTPLPPQLYSNSPIHIYIYFSPLPFVSTLVRNTVCLTTMMMTTTTTTTTLQCYQRPQNSLTTPPPSVH